MNRHFIELSVFVIFFIVIQTLSFIYRVSSHIQVDSTKHSHEIRLMKKSDVYQCGPRTKQVIYLNTLVDIV